MASYANLGSVLFWWKEMYTCSLAICCCLHCAVDFNILIIKDFFLSAPCWTLCCNGGINWSALTLSKQSCLISSSLLSDALCGVHTDAHTQRHIGTHTYTYYLHRGTCMWRKHMQIYTLWYAMVQCVSVRIHFCFSIHWMISLYSAVLIFYTHSLQTVLTAVC